MLIDPTRHDNITLHVRIVNTGVVPGLATVGVYYSMGLSRFVRYRVTATRVVPPRTLRIDWKFLIVAWLMTVSDSILLVFVLSGADTIRCLRALQSCSSLSPPGKQ